ncbi:MAG: cytochrome c-type biogenesis protein [Caulobacterales bacterium]
MIGAIILAAVMGLETPLADPAAEKRAQDLFMEIKCVVCEGEPIAQSGAEVAADMRIRVRQEVAAGKTDAQIRQDFADRYGDAVLLRPRAAGLGALLWLFPFGALLAGAAVIWRSMAAQRKAGPRFEPDPD